MKIQQEKRISVNKHNNSNICASDHTNQISKKVHQSKSEIPKPKKKKKIDKLIDIQKIPKPNDNLHMSKIEKINKATYKENIVENSSIDLQQQNFQKNKKRDFVLKQQPEFVQKKNELLNLHDRLMQLDKERFDIENKLYNIKNSHRSSQVNVSSNRSKKYSGRNNSNKKNIQESARQKSSKKSLGSKANIVSGFNSKSSKKLQNSEKQTHNEKNMGTPPTNVQKKFNGSVLISSSDVLQFVDHKDILSNIIDTDYGEFDFIQDYGELLDWSTSVFHDFQDPPFLYAFLQQELFQTAFIWNQNFLEDRQNRYNLVTKGLDYCFNNIDPFRKLVQQNLKKVINNARTTWFSFFSRVSEAEQHELQNSLSNIFDILVYEPKFLELLCRLINITMYMKARPDPLSILIKEFPQREIFISFFDPVKMKSIFSNTAAAFNSLDYSSKVFFLS